MLAAIWESGEGVKRNLAKAVIWHRRVLENTCKEGQTKRYGKEESEKRMKMIFATNPEVRTAREFQYRR